MSTVAKTRIFPVAYFHQETGVTKSTMRWPARSLAVPPLPSDNKQLDQWLKSPLIDVLDIDQVFTPYSHKFDKNKRILFTHVMGGIGDVIAFSSIAEFVRNKTLTVFTDPKYFPIFKWFSNQDIRIKSVNDVIAYDFTPANRLTRYANYARLRMEYAAVYAGPEDWYKAMFNRIGIDVVPDGFDRPRLVRRTDVKSSISKKNSVIISHRSSCQMRSSKFEDFYFPVRSVLPMAEIYVHAVDLTEDDLNFVKKVGGGIIVIPPCSIEQYLDNIYAASMVVCTDTSAIHFREGVTKPCLGVFSAMTTQSRTSGYKHTHSFNVKSSCPHQPCFVHELKKGDHCPAWVEGETVARCQVGESFQEQLFQQLKGYVK